MNKTDLLRAHFPMIRSRDEVLAEIRGRDSLRAVYESWNEEQQDLFLDLCSGVRGVKMLYDGFFKEIMNPDAVPERLEELLSLLLGQPVKILKVLPNDTTRIGAEGTLLIMDIVVELANGSIANVECQRSGYAFPGQRAACYSADLLMRQYKRVRGERKKAFSYRDIRKVYTIIFYEQSPPAFHQLPQYYIHRSRQETDTGVKLELLQEFLFLPLDIYFRFHYNKGIKNKLEAWLTFLGNDDPEAVLNLLVEYPEFQVMYEEVYELCRNLEKIMGLFSKELLELDRNTVQYMIDEMQDTIDQQKTMLNEKDAALLEKDALLARQKDNLNEKDAALLKKDAEIAALKKQLAGQGIRKA